MRSRGTYSDANFVYHGFVRAANGAITTFDVPGANMDLGFGTFPASINPSGKTTGVYYDADLVVHGYVRAANGAITTFSVPGAGTGEFQGTGASNINPSGDVIRRLR